MSCASATRRVIIKEIDGMKCEPIEVLTIDAPEEVAGKCIEQVSMRKGMMINYGA